MADVWKEAARHFAACSEPCVGTRIESVWEEGIAEALGPGRALTLKARPSREDRPLARSQAAILELLRSEGGATTRTIAAIAEKLALPPSTFSGALRTLQERGLILRDGRSIQPAGREV